MQDAAVWSDDKGHLLLLLSEHASAVVRDSRML
jgi:hypothetical protein